MVYEYIFVIIFPKVIEITYSETSLIHDTHFGKHIVLIIN